MDIITIIRNKLKFLQKLKVDDTQKSESTYNMQSDVGPVQVSLKSEKDSTNE